MYRKERIELFTQRKGQREQTHRPKRGSKGEDNGWGLEVGGFEPLSSSMIQTSPDVLNEHSVLPCLGSGLTGLSIFTSHPHCRSTVVWNDGGTELRKARDGSHGCNSFCLSLSNSNGLVSLLPVCRTVLFLRRSLCCANVSGCVCVSVSHRPSYLGTQKSHRRSYVNECVADRDTRSSSHTRSSLIIP